MKRPPMKTSRTRSAATPRNGRRRRASPPASVLFDERQVQVPLEDRASHHETSPALTGGDVDADWRSAHSIGEEAVGGSVATPDQDIVDALGSALGVPQGLDEPVRTAREILEQRDAQRWQIEREIERNGDVRGARPRRRKSS